MIDDRAKGGAEIEQAVGAEEKGLSGFETTSVLRRVTTGDCRIVRTSSSWMRTSGPASKMSISFIDAKPSETGSASAGLR